MAAPKKVEAPAEDTAAEAVAVEAPEEVAAPEAVADEIELDVPDSPEEQVAFVQAVEAAVDETRKEFAPAPNVDTQRWDSWTVQDGGLPVNAELPKVNAVSPEQLPDADVLKATGVDVDSFEALIEVQDA
jgi:hypothetical protein